ncbi:MAG: DUF4861 family protein [Candidatus Sumerlaeia bacterium]
MKSRLILAALFLFFSAVAVHAQEGDEPQPARRGRRADAAPVYPPFVMTPEQKALAEARQANFEYVFGGEVKLDPAMIAKVRAARPGQRFYADTNNDGKPEEAWFIDPGAMPGNRPLLVRAIDKTGKLKEGDEVGRANATFVADCHADGLVDSVVDYEDTDGDGDLDRMGIFTARKESVDCWWSRDDGDDNLLWHDIDYRYSQTECQYRTHFGGSESFYALRIRPGEDRWTCRYENPFLFFDRDGDGVTEEVVRVVSEGGLVASLRWSFDADGDGAADSPRDYDVSISARAPGWTLAQGDRSSLTLRYGEDVCKTETVRGFKTNLMMDPGKCVGWLMPVTWAAALMTWDEDDDNVTPRDTGLGERWEGILNHAYSEDGKVVFPQVGGPPCSRFNKRNEYLAAPKGPLEYYFLPADKRLHLKGADRSFIDVDMDRDGRTDMFYEFVDADRNGYVDKMTVDVNGDGKIDDAWPLDQAGIAPVAWTFEAINQATGPVEKQEPAKLYALNCALLRAIEKNRPNTPWNAAWTLLNNRFRCATTTEALQQKLLSSDESILFYLRLSADQALCALKAQAAGDAKFLGRFEAARSRGDIDAMTRLVRKAFKVSAPPQTYADWIGALRARPQGPLVGWDNQWLPPNYGWESLQGAFRMYDGHFDTFGKSRDVLCYPILNADKEAMIRNNTSWGMDILHGGQTCGLGGLMLWVNGTPCPVYKIGKAGPEFTWTAGPVVSTRDKVTLECVATNVGTTGTTPYTVRFRMSALAGRADSPIEVTITGGDPGDKLEVGVGLGFQSQGRPMGSETFMIDGQAGVMGVRGWQDPSIGWAGFGVVFPADRFLRVETMPFQHFAVLKYKVGETFTYSIQSDWVRGHRFPVAPSPEDWMNQLRRTAKLANY